VKTVVSILGTRPEIIKFSPLLPILDRAYRHVLVHTGQHYDENMDRIFFRELKLKPPKHFLNVGSGRQGAQTARMLERLEPILIKLKPDMTFVLGDTNSTLAGMLAATKLNIPVAHIEAGCRSFNWSMPEEKNRVLVDHASTLLFSPDRDAVAHLKAEGIARSKVHLVGNTVLDATARTMKITSRERLKKFAVKPTGFVLATLHRAENTDDPERLRSLIYALNTISAKIPVLFPIHPRTQAVLRRHRIQLHPGLKSLAPLGNLDFIALLKDSLFVLSDSGGIQEEAAVVNRPCLILREDTEWTRLVDAGKNFLVGIKPDDIIQTADKLIVSPAFYQQVRQRRAPLSFGATKRIKKVLVKYFDS
jgi:UDP-N-acetylglucosamine 2-epimerase